MRRMLFILQFPLTMSDVIVPQYPVSICTAPQNTPKNEDIPKMTHLNFNQHSKNNPNSVTRQTNPLSNLSPATLSAEQVSTRRANWASANVNKRHNNKGPAKTMQGNQVYHKLYSTTTCTALDMRCYIISLQNDTKTRITRLSGKRRKKLTDTILYNVAVLSGLGGASESYPAGGASGNAGNAGHTGQGGEGLARAPRPRRFAQGRVERGPARPDLARPAHPRRRRPADFLQGREKSVLGPTLEIPAQHVSLLVSALFTRASCSSPLFPDGAVVLADGLVELDPAPLARGELRRSQVPQHSDLGTLARRDYHPLP